MFGHKTNLNKFKKTEIKQGMLSCQNGRKLEIDSSRKTEKSTNVEINNTFLDNQQVKEFTREIRKYLQTNGNENTTHQNLQEALKAV